MSKRKVFKYTVYAANMEAFRLPKNGKLTNFFVNRSARKAREVAKIAGDGARIERLSYSFSRWKYTTFVYRNGTFKKIKE